MTSQTAAFSALLTEKSAASIPPNHKPPQPKTPFLIEAYSTASLLTQLTTLLRSTHQPYLSLNSATLNETDRDTLDADIQALLRQAFSLITRLKQTEDVRASTASAKHAKAKNTWRAILSAGKGDDGEEDVEEVAERCVREHHESVLWWLNKRLAEASDEQRKRQEVRLKRKVERGRSVLSEQKALGVRNGDGLRKRDTAGTRNVRSGGDEEDEVVRELGKDVVMMLEQENQGLVTYYEDALSQVRTAETSLLEISELQTQLVTQLSEQNSVIDNLMQDSLTTEENVSRGNKELKKAAERRSIARLAFFTSVGFSAFVVVWDWFI